MKNKGNLYIFFTALLWSTSGVFIKYITGTPIAINGLRSIIAFLFFCLYRRSPKMLCTKITFSAAVCLTLTNLLFVTAAKMTTAANTITLQYLAPIFVLIWDSLYHKRKPQLFQLICVLVAFLGMVLFFIDGLGSGYMLGNLIAIGAGLCFSGVFFINSLEGSSSEDSSMMGFLMSFIISIPFLKSGFEYTTTSMLAVSFLGLFQVGLAYILYGIGIKLTTALNASLISLLEVIFNPLWVYLIFGETLSKFALIGATVIIVSVVTNIVMSSKQQA